MNVMIEKQASHPFIQDGGEMGLLTREYDWASTPIGSVDQWPRSLQTILGVILHSDFPMFLWWGKEMIQFYNDAYRPSLGNNGKHPTALGQRGVECWPEIWSIIFPLIEQVRNTGKSFFSEDQLVPIFRNGKIEDVYWTFSYSPVIGDTGKIDGILVVCNETTKKVQAFKDIEIAQAKLEYSENNLRNMILQAPVAMCILKGHTLIVEIANQKILEIWGKSFDEVIARPLFEGLPEAKSQGLEDLLEKVMTTGESFVAYERPVNLLKNGKLERKYINFVYEALRDGSGLISGVMAVAIEVTEQVLARQRIEDLVDERTNELAESNRSLQRSNRELAQFAYITSHDLQEPIRKIRTFTEMLQNHLGTSDARARNYLGKIEISASRMLTLIRDILSFSQLEKGVNVYDTINLNEILDSVQNDFELLIEQKRAIINNKGLPIIQGIPVQINQLFSNLISNSLKFSNQARACQITIESKLFSEEEVRNNGVLNPESNYYELSFSDNGIGFSQDNAAQIFDIFQRLHGRTEYEGTGIGLAMCKKIVQNHNGDIYAESIPGEGATFHVILPMIQQIR